MSFTGEVRWARTRGIGAALAGLACAVVSVALDAGGFWLAGLASGAAMILIAGGAMLALVGGVMRPAQRRAYAHGLPAGRLREVASRQRALRWWFGIDAGGQLRDD